MKPFDLTAALSGEPIMWHEWTYTVERVDIANRTLHCLNNDAVACYIDVDFTGHPTMAPREVVTMAPRKTRKTVWINVYRDAYGGFISCAWSTKDGADAHAADRIGEAHPIEIEVEE